MSKFIIGIIITLLLVVVAIPRAAFAGNGDYNDATNPQFGGEWTNEDNINWGDDDVEDMYNALQDAGWADTWGGSFKWGGTHAWEQDFKYKEAPGGGTDYLWIDDVDLAWFTGHGSNWRLHFLNPDHDDENLHYYEARWGDHDLEWIMLHSCHVLMDDSLDLWHGTMMMLHLICGSKSTIYDKEDGKNVAKYLIDSDGSGPDVAYTVQKSWFYGCDVHQASGVTLRCMSEYWLYGYEYIWGQGRTYADVPGDPYYSVYTYNCS